MLLSVDIQARALDELAERVIALEADRNAWREKANSWQREAKKWRRRSEAIAQDRDLHRDRARALEESRSYRLGNAILRLLAWPRQLVSGLGREARPTKQAAVEDSQPANSQLVSDNGVDPPPQDATPVGDPIAEAADLRIAGPLLDGSLPVHAYVLLGFAEDQLRSSAQAIVEAASIASDHVPLLVTDCAMFSQVRESGIAVEYIPNQKSWERHRDEATWEPLLSRRMSSLVRLYGPVRMVIVTPPDTLDLNRVLTLTSRSG